MKGDMMEMDGMASDITWYEKFLGDMLWLTLSEGHTRQSSKIHEPL